MKKSKTNIFRNIFYILILLISSSLTILSCSSDDSIEAPSVSYSSIEATFFRAGNSDVPNIDWNGNIGTFALPNIFNTNFSIDNTTGVLSWTKLLSPGIYNLPVKVTNSAGETTINVNLDNTLQGDFIGSYRLGFGIDFYLSIKLNTDGSTILEANDEQNPSIGIGTWTYLRFWC